MTVTALLLFSLALPWAAPPLARRVLDRCRPGAALWTLTASAALLAGATLAALATLALTGLLALAPFAALGELIHPLRASSGPLTLPLAAAAGALLACAAARVCRTALRQTRALRTARVRADGAAAAGDLRVLDDPAPDAYALPGRPPRIVVTSAMLRTLSAREREVLFAHERAHNAGGHHWFLALAELCAPVHPALGALCDTVRLAAERVADEEAAAVVGDRRLTARAIARAALASAASGVAPRAAVTPAMATGPVPHRVTALLGPARRPTRWLAAALAACALLTCATAATCAVRVHQNIEVAQGETGR